MLNLLIMFCIFSVALTPIDGKLDLTYKGETVQVEHNFTFECNKYEYEIKTHPYWLNSVADMRVFFFDDFIVWYYEDRPGRHDENWVINIFHEETDTQVTEKIKDRDWLPLPIQEGKNTYSFRATVYSITFEIPEVMIVWRHEK